MSDQLTFDLPHRTALGRQDFFISATNAVALAAIDGWQGWPMGKMLLTGPAGSGKSHLAAVWAADSGAAIVAGGDLAGADVPALAALGAVVVEDAETVAGDPAAEEALFHLHNMLLPAGRLLLTAASPPRDWGLGLPDLASRMQATAITRIDPPDDALLSAVLVKLFADRQIAVPANLIPYLVARIERSIAAAAAVVAGLDARALQLGRAVSRQMAAEWLDSAAGQ